MGPSVKLRLGTSFSAIVYVNSAAKVDNFSLQLMTDVRCIIQGVVARALDAQ